MRLAAIAAGFMLLATASGPAQEIRSLTDSGYGASALRGASRDSVVLRPGDGADDVALYEKLVLAQATINALTESLAISNAEAEVFKRQVADLSLRLEALGLEGAADDEAGLRQKLISAVRDLRLANEKNEEASNQLVRLTEAVLTLLRIYGDVDPETRATVEAELRKTGQILGTSKAQTELGIPADASLTDAKILDVKDDLSLVILNVGRKHDVKIGMPFHVFRGNTRLGEVRVVDVRDRISGAIIQNLDSDQNRINVGDRLRVIARQ